MAQSAATTPELPTATEKAAVDQLIPWLLDEDQQLRGVPFTELIFAATGKKVLPFDPNVVDQRVAKAISAACDEAMRRLNAPDSPIQNIDRINKASSYFEDSLRKLLNATAGLQCDSPLTGEGKLQRSGHLDLRITDLESTRLLFGQSFTLPQAATAVSALFVSSPGSRPNKVPDDAVHFVVGFEHAARDVAASLSRGDSGSDQNTATKRRGYNTMWKFTRWDLVDLSRFTVKLKAEFQESNRDMYRPEAIVASSAER